MKYLTLLLIFSIALCACPNNCNSHGKCENGVCKCFRSIGLEDIPDAGFSDSGNKLAKYNLESYYGADCSRKMCPLGITYASIRETGYNVDLNPTVEYDAASKTYNTPVAEPDRRMDDQLVKGGEQMPTAVSSYSTGVGANHMYAECSGAGICNSETGVCECYDGFEGKACQRMSCPNRCSGKGKCVPLNQAVGLDGNTGNDIKELFGFNGRVDKTGKYEMSDTDSEAKFFGCLCDKGFRGPDCSLRECPSGVDPQGASNVWTLNNNKPVKPDLDSEQRDCSGRGKCNYNLGECECFDGFSGANCATMTTYM